MAALTAASTQIRNIGDSTMHVIKFSSVNVDDTYASSITGVQSFWAQNTSDPVTNTSTGVNVTESSGTFTFYPGIAASAVTLYVLSGSGGQV